MTHTESTAQSSDLSLSTSTAASGASRRRPWSRCSHSHTDLSRQSSLRHPPFSRYAPARRDIRGVAVPSRTWAPGSNEQAYARTQQGSTLACQVVHATLQALPSHLPSHRTTQIFNADLFRRLIQLGAPLSRNLVQLLRLMYQASRQEHLPSHEQHQLLFDWNDEDLLWGQYGKLEASAYEAVMHHGVDLVSRTFFLNQWSR